MNAFWQIYLIGVVSGLGGLAIVLGFLNLVEMGRMLEEDKKQIKNQCQSHAT